MNQYSVRVREKKGLIINLQWTESNFDAVRTWCSNCMDNWETCHSLPSLSEAAILQITFFDSESFPEPFEILNFHLAFPSWL